MSDEELLKSLEAILDSEEFSINTIPIEIDRSLCLKCKNNFYGYCLELFGAIPYVKDFCAGYKHDPKK